MKKENLTPIKNNRKLVLRKESIRALDNIDLVFATGGGLVPPDAGSPPLPG